MKHTILSIITGAAVLCGCLSAQAANTDVPAKLQETTYLTEARPDLNARFYAYLCSASWCGPCRAIMPQVVAQYKDIKAAGGEVILVCFDLDTQKGTEYVKKYNAAFPAVMGNLRAEMQSDLPGFTPRRGIPSVIFVKPDGTQIYSGHGQMLLKWREITAGK